MMGIFKNSWTFLFLLIAFSSFSQEVNQTDAQGRKQGKWIKFYEGTKQKRYVGQFKDDIPVGSFTYYYQTGEPSAVSVFSNNGTVTFTKTYHKNGSLMAKGKYVDQKKDSVWWYFNANKEVLSKENYENGKLEGEVIVYYPSNPKNGSLKIYEITTYKEGVKNGHWKQYFSNGKVKGKGTYKDGYYVGKVYWYHPNGQVEIESFYKHTVPNGFWFYFDDKGNLINKVYYLNGDILEGEKLEKHLEKVKADKEKNKG